MLKKITLLLIICSMVAFGFAQKSKRKSTLKAPKSNYFVMLINGEKILTDTAGRYCPNDSILFDFAVLDTNIKNFTFCWHDGSHDTICNTTPIKWKFSIIAPEPNITTYKINVYFEILSDTIPIKDTLTTIIKIDYLRTDLDTTICQGRSISVFLGDSTYTYHDVQSDKYTPWNTLYSISSGCDSLVRWHIRMDPYIYEEYSISSCDSVKWENEVRKRRIDIDDAYPDSILMVFPAMDPDMGCDTLKVLIFTIIDTAQLKIEFNQKDFCSQDDMKGTINLKTNLTAFDWTYSASDKSFAHKDSVWTVFDPKIEIENPGYYRVLAYMDTSLYDTLKNLRIVNSCFKYKDTVVYDCDLIIPDVITPNGDNLNEFFGIKKLNPKRENELIIYDIWGRNVFQQKNYKCVFKGEGYHNIEEAFKGLSRGGQKLPEGTYYYAFKYKAIPNPKTYTGVLMILR